MTTQALNQSNAEREAEIFSTLADPTRLKLVKLLCLQRTPDALCVNALSALLGVSQSAVSQHLRVLKNNGLVKGERRGYHIHYCIDRSTLEYCHNLISQVLAIKVLNKEEV
jgi:ArsR family transcriptional regulator